MDRYTFRGKRIDNGELVFGLLTMMWGQFHIIDPQDENTAYLIDQKTVGQCTGLHDKNGKAIFEGDIVQIDCYSYMEPESGGFGVIEIGSYGYGLRIPVGNGCFEWNCLCDIQGSHTTTYEVLGNIHDNPELLNT